MDIKSVIVSKQLFGDGGATSPGGGTVEVDILPEQKVDGFAPDESMGGAYSANVVGEFPPLVIGQKYTVLWDGDEYTCTAIDLSEMQAGAVAVGDFSGFGGEGNGEPCIVMYAPCDGGALYGFLAVDGSTDTSRTIRIYQTVKTEAVAPQDISVPLNMATGDQVLTPDEGRAFSCVTIQKPETLIPENIAEGINIAGIIGALAAGGGGAKVATGKYSPKGTGVETITHGLGVVPDIIFVWSGTYANEKISRAMGISTAFKAVLPSFCAWPSYYLTGTAGSAKADNSTPIVGMDARTAGPDIHNVTIESFSFGSPTYPLITGFSYIWVAIGGLT